MSTHSNFIYQLVNNSEITIDNFRQIAVPIAKHNSSVSEFPVDHDKLSEGLFIWYTKSKVDSSKYTDSDILEFNKNLWIDRSLYKEVSRLLKMISYKGNIYDVVIEILNLEFLYNVMKTSKEKLKPVNSSYLFWENLLNMDDSTINRFYIILKKNNKREQFNYNSDTIRFIKKAILNYVDSEYGKVEFDNLKSEYETNNAAINIIKSWQEGGKTTTIKLFKSGFARKLNQLFFVTCRKEIKRYYAIGELMVLAIGVSKQYNNSTDKFKFHYDSIRKLI